VVDVLITLLQCVIVDDCLASFVPYLFSAVHSMQSRLRFVFSFTVSKKSLLLCVLLLLGVRIDPEFPDWSETSS